MIILRRRTLLLAAVAAAMGGVGATAGCTSSAPVLAEVRIGSGPGFFRVEIAQTAEQQRDGLSGRDHLSPGTGMLFRFGSRRQQQVWMAGMKFPIDIAWIAEGKIIGIDTLTTCGTDDTCRRWTSPGPVDCLLEVPAHGLDSITLGTDVAIDELR